MNYSLDLHSKHQRDDIQGLRAIAVALVLLFHFGGIIKGGYLGVDIFFVVSGFVIAQSTIREIHETSTFSWRNFLRRRVRRLLPGAALVLVFSSVAGYLLGVVDFQDLKVTTLLMLAVGGYCMVGASNAFNQVIEKDLDA